MSTGAVVFNMVSIVVFILCSGMIYAYFILRQPLAQTDKKEVMLN